MANTKKTKKIKKQIRLLNNKETLIRLDNKQNKLMVYLIFLNAIIKNFFKNL